MDLEAIIQKMIDAGESEENIAAVIKQFETDEMTANAGPIEEPTTWGGGFMDSILGGESGRAAGAGLKGFAKGAILDLPETIMGGVKSVANMMQGPEQTGEELGKMWEGIKETPGRIWEAGKKAGSDPENFGRVMGQVTGQPALTAGLAKYGPSAAIKATPKIGKGLEVVGNTVANHGAMSGLMPPIAVPHYLRLGERGLGRVAERIGQRMQNVGKQPWEVTSSSTIRNEGTRPITPSRGSTGPIEGEIVGPSPKSLGGPRLLNEGPPLDRVGPKGLYPPGLPPVSPRKITMKMKSLNSELASRLRERGYIFEGIEGDNVILSYKGKQ